MYHVFKEWGGNITSHYYTSYEEYLLEKPIQVEGDTDRDSRGELYCGIAPHRKSGEIRDGEMVNNIY